MSGERSEIAPTGRRQVLRTEAETHIWPQGHPARDNSGYTPGQLTRDLQQNVVGIPKDPVAAMPYVGENITPDEMRHVEDRTWTNNGFIIMSEQSPQEKGVGRALRPGRDVVEVGRFRKDGEHLADHILADDGELRFNGDDVDGDKIDFIRGVVESEGVRRVTFHNFDGRLVEIAAAVGLEPREALEDYERFGGKSSLNAALRNYRKRHPDASIGEFGISFQGISEAVSEVVRLREYGVGSYVKLDRFGDGPYLTSGIGQMLLSSDVPIEAAQARLESLFGQQGRSGLENAQGVVQMFVPENTIFSLSTGQRPDGSYGIYEAHVQRQVQGIDGNFAFDGASPLANNDYTHRLFTEIWPQVRQLYAYNGIRGDQNADIMVIPPAYRDLARELYGNPALSDQVLIDLNLRPIAGTRAAMSRFVEETGRQPDLENFVVGSIDVDSHYAANPHKMYAAAGILGLWAGEGGNFAITNHGYFTPEAARMSYEQGTPLSCQVLIQDVDSPERYMDRLAARFEEPPSRTGTLFVHPREAPEIDKRAYTELVHRGVREATLSK